MTEQAFVKIYKATYKLDEDYIGSIMRYGGFRISFQILHTQQFYLQKSVIKETFASQLKIYTKLVHKYDINKLFQTKTGLSIEDMLCLLQTLWIIVFYANKVSDTIKYQGLVEKDHLQAMVELSGREKMEKFIKLLLIDPDNANEKIKTAPYSFNNEQLQSFERTFFTIYPLLAYKKKFIKVIHPGVLAHTINHYVYDFLKREASFPEEFGHRIEKYVALGLVEIDSNYISEAQLRKRFGRDANVVDFALEDERILIECKAIELSPSLSVMPTAKALYSGLKGSVIKAYTEQMLSIAEQLGASENQEYYGIIITYKEMYWSKFEDLFEVIKEKLPAELKTKILSPTNVFIIDLPTWDKIVQIIKDKKATLRQILAKAKMNNTDAKTTKMLFEMHLDEYNLEKLNLSYLTDELKYMDTYFKR